MAKIKQFVKAGDYRITASARKTAIEDFFLLESGIIDVIMSIEIADLYKSMPSYNDTNLWQDVYHKKISNKIAYIKLQIIENNSIIISFKEK